jgi:hypothetical protein
MYLQNKILVNIWHLGPQVYMNTKAYFADTYKYVRQQL